jgi:hypothetical protein
MLLPEQHNYLNVHLGFIRNCYMFQSVLLHVSADKIQRDDVTYGYN